MERPLRDRDIVSLLLEEVDEDHEDIVFNSSDEESHEVTEETHETYSIDSEEDLFEIVADENSSDSESDSKMDMPLSEMTTRPSGRTHKGKDGTLWHKISARLNVRTRSENIVTGTPGVKVFSKKVHR